MENKTFNTKRKSIIIQESTIHNNHVNKRPEGDLEVSNRANKTNQINYALNSTIVGKGGI